MSDTAPELKPCPFCGEEADPEGWLRGDGVRGPECINCGATAASVEQWNTRSDIAAKRIAALEREVSRLERYVDRCELRIDGFVGEFGDLYYD